MCQAVSRGHQGQFKEVHFRPTRFRPAMCAAAYRDWLLHSIHPAHLRAHVEVPAGIPAGYAAACRPGQGGNGSADPT